MTTLEQAIGAEVKRRREADGARQEQLAAAARKYGLKWSQATIAAVELGRRKLSLGELAFLPLILSEALGDTDAGGQLFSIAELIPDAAQDVDVAPGLRLPLSTVRMLLSGQAAADPAPPRQALALEASGDPERKAARKLGVPARAVVLAARKLWGHGLAEERERRLGALEQLPRRRLQARRGGITRRLVRELEPVVRAARGRQKGR
jgi:transcriptional regulator with XRE-family HTH domain